MAGSPREGVSEAHLRAFWPALAIVLALSAAGRLLPTRAWAGEQTAPQPLVMGLTSTFPPLSFTFQGRMTGFSVDLGEAVAQAMGVPAEIRHSAQWTDVLDWMRRGEIRCVPLAARSAERDKEYDFSDTVLQVPERIFVAQRTTGITDIADLYGKRVAAVDRHASAEFLRQFPEIRMVMAPSVMDAMLQVINGNADALLYPQQMVEYLSKNIRASDGLKAVGAPVRVLDYCVMVTKGDATLLKQVNSALASLHATGAYQRIHDRWFSVGILDGYSDREILLGLLGLMSMTIFAGALGATWIINTRLRRRAEREAQAARAAEGLATDAVRRQFRAEREAERFFNLSADPICIADANGAFLSANPAWEKVLGRNPKEMMSIPFLDLVHPDDRESTRAEMVKTFAGSPSQHFENRFLHKDGTWRWLSWTSTFLPEEGLVYALARDVTEHRAAEEEIRRGRATLETALESMTDAVFISDANGAFLHFNEAFASIHRFRTREECARTFNEYPDILDVFLENGKPASLDQWAIPRALRGEKVANAIYGLRRKDTGETWVGSYGFGPIRDPDGTIVGAVVVGRDVTESQRMHEQAARWQRVFENSGFGLAMVNARDNTFLAVNRAFAAEHGYAPEEMAGMSVLDLYPQERRKEAMDRIHEIDTRSHSVFETAHLRRSGESFPLLMEVTVFQDERGRPSSRVVYALDITERKRQQRILEEQAEELRRSNAELEQFAYVASHDLQEPLRKIASFLELLSRRYSGRLDSDADEFIGFAVDAAKRMKVMIEDLLAYSRLNTRAEPPSPTDLNEVMASVRSDLGLALEDAGGELSWKELPVVLADRSQMGQLLRNLVGNAVKYRGEEPPRVRVEAEHRDGTWTVRVRDNGIGIHPDHFERIFKVFQRLHGQGKYPGTGIGLALCRKIVERHGGRIWVESEPGKGSTFLFTLPERPKEARHG